MSVVDLLRITMPHCDAAAWAPAIEQTFNTFGISTPIRQACFIGQAAVESGELCHVEEDLKYSADRLVSVWPSHFQNLDAAMPYADNPEKLANHIYALRNGNGDEASGDGWRFRGRGLFQLTGKISYERAQSYLAKHGIAVNLVVYPEMLVTPLYAAMSAGSYWELARLNICADRVPGFGSDAFRVLTRRINGGLINLAARVAYANMAWSYLTGTHA
jgi:putative chitinase